MTRYGPHDPTDVPTTVTVWCAGRYPVCDRAAHPHGRRHDVVLPMPRPVARLREQINNLAREDTSA